MVGWGREACAVGSYRAFSLQAAQRLAQSAGDRLAGRQAKAHNLLGINRELGVVYGEAPGRVVIVGQQVDKRPPLTLDDLAVALRAKMTVGKWPLVSIDPTPRTRKTGLQKVRFEGGIQDAAFGKTFSTLTCG